MSSEIDQRIVEMKFENGQFENGVKNSISTLEKLKSALKFDTRADGFENIQKSADSLNFSKVEEALDSVINRYSTLGIIGARVIENLVDKAMTGIDTVIGKIQSGGMSRALNLEQAKFTLEGLDVKWDETLQTGVAKNVNDAVTDTAFGLDAAAKAASQLVASNVEVGESMDHALKAISGVAAMTNSTYDDIANVFTRIAGNGKVMAMDLMSFSSRGLNAAAELGRVLNYTEAEIREMVSDGEINFEIFSEAMYKAFADHAKKANETFTGAMSNTNAALSRIGERFATPYIQNMRPVLVELIDFLKAINKSINPLVDSVSGVMSKISTAVSDRLHTITGQLVDINDKSRPLLTGASNWMLKISTALKEIIDGLGGMVSMFTDFWSTAFNVPDSNPLVDFANGLYEAASVFKYAFTGIANEDSAAVKEFIAIFGDSSGIFEDFKAAVTSVANVINILYSKLRLIWQKIVQPLAMRVLPAILKYIRSVAEEIETIVKLLLDNKIVDTAISGIGKGLTTVADLIFSIGGKAEDSAKQVQKAAEDTATAVSDSAKTIKNKTEDIFSDTKLIIAHYSDLIREYAGGVFGDEHESESWLRYLGFSWDEIDKFKELVEEYNKVGESLFDGIEKVGESADERLNNAFDNIYNKNAQLIDSLKQEAIESVQSTFKHVSFDERSVEYMGDTFFNRFYDKLVDNGFGEKDALAIVHKFRDDFIDEYRAQSEEDWKTWQEAVAEESKRHEELRAEFARDYSKDRESMMGWTSSSVYSDMEKANKAFDKAWDKINSKNKGKSFDQLDYSQMFNDFYEESYKALIDMGMSEDEAIRRSLINKQTYINKWAEMDEETFLLMEANAEEYVKTLDEMTAIEKIAFTIRNIFDTITSVGQKAYNNVIKPIGEFIGGLGKKAWASISTSAQNIWGWVTKTWGLFKNSKAFQDVSKTFKDMKTNAENLWGSLSKVLEPLLDLIPEIKIPEFDPEIAERFAKALGNIATAVSKGLSGAVQKLVDFKEAVKKHLVFDPVTGNLDILGTLQKNIEDFTSFIQEKAGVVRDFVGGLFELDDEGHLKKIEELKDAIRGFFTNDETGEIDIFGTLLSKAEEVFQPILDKINAIGEAIRKTFTNEETGEIDVLGGLKKIALDAFEQISNKIDEVKKKIKAFFGIVDEEDPVELIITENGDVDTSKIEKVVKDIPWLDSAVQSFNQTIQGIPSAVSTLMDDLGITNVIEAIGSAIETAQKKVEDFIKFVQGIPASIASTFTQLFGNPLEKLSPITDALAPFGEAILGFIPKEIPKDGIIGMIFGGFGTAFDTVMGTAQKFGDYILGLPASITAAFENFTLEDTLNNAFKFLLNFPEKINSIFGPDNIKKIFDSLFTNDNRNNPEVLKGWVAQDVAPFITLTEGIKEKAGEIRDAIAGIFSDDEGNFDIFVGLKKAFEGFIEFLKGIPGRIAEVFSGISLFGDENDPEVLKGWVAPKKGVVDGILGGLQEMLSGPIATIQETLAGLFPEDGPIAKGVAAVSGAFSTLKQTFDEFVSFDFSQFNIIDTIKQGLSELATFLDETFPNLSNLFGLFKNPGDLGAASEEVQETVEELGSALGYLKEVTLMPEDTPLAAAPPGAEQAEGSKSIFQSIADIIGNVVDLISSVFTKVTETIPKLLESATNIVDQLPDLTPMIDAAFSVITDFAGGVFDAITGMLNFIHEKWPEVQEFFKPFSENLGKITGKALSSVGEGINNFIDGIANAPEKEDTGDANMLTTFLDGIKTVIGKLGEIAQTIVDNSGKIGKALLVGSITKFIFSLSGLVDTLSINLGGGTVIRSINGVITTINGIGTQMFLFGGGIALLVGALAWLDEVDPDATSKRIDQLKTIIWALLGIEAGKSVGRGIFSILSTIIGTVRGEGAPALSVNIGGLLSNVGLTIAGLGAGIFMITSAVINLGNLEDADTVLTTGLTRVQSIIDSIFTFVGGLMLTEGGITVFGQFINGALGTGGQFEVGLEGVASTILALGGGVFLLGVAIKSMAFAFTDDEFQLGLDRVQSILVTIGLGVAGIFAADGFKNLLSGLGGYASNGKKASAGLGTMVAVFAGIAASIFGMVWGVKEFGSMPKEELEQGMDAMKDMIDVIGEKVKDILVAFGGINAVGNLFGGSGSGDGSTGPVEKLKNVGKGLKELVEAIPLPGPLKAIGALTAGTVTYINHEAEEAKEEFAKLGPVVSDAFGVDHETFMSTIIEELGKSAGEIGGEDSRSLINSWLGGYFNSMTESGEYVSLSDYLANNPVTAPTEALRQQLEQAILTYDTVNSDSAGVISSIKEQQEAKGYADGHIIIQEAADGYAIGLEKGMNETEEKPVDVVFGEEHMPEIVVDEAAKESSAQKHEEIGHEIGVNDAEHYVKGRSDGILKTIVEGDESIINSVTGTGTETGEILSTELDNSAGLVRQSAENMADGAKAGIEAKRPETTEASRLTGEESWTQVDSYVPSWGVSGTNAAVGFINAIRNKTQDAIDAAKIFASEPLAAMRTILNEHSPSRETGQIAIYAALGFINEINNSIPAVRSASEGMASSFLDGLSTASDLASQVLSDDFQLDPTIQPIIDSSQIQNGVNEINGLFGQRSLDLATNASVEFTNQQQQMYESMQYPDPINYVDQFTNLRTDLNSLREAIINSPITLDSGILVGALRPQMDSALGSMSMRRNRGL